MLVVLTNLRELAKVVGSVITLAIVLYMMVQENKGESNE